MVEELAARIKKDGIYQLSGAIFREFTNSKGDVVPANTTVQEYCEREAIVFKVTPDEYAAELLRSMDAPSVEIVGECPKCYALLSKEESQEHVCTPEK